MKNLSRNAQLVALALFGNGYKSSAVFVNPSKITQKTQEAIDEMLREEMIEVIEPSKMPRGAVGWKGTRKIGFPICELKHPTHEETFNLVDESEAA